MFFVCCLFVFPSRFQDQFSCMRIVCEFERPSELSWRTRHGRKKKGKKRKKKKCVRLFHPRFALLSWDGTVRVCVPFFVCSCVLVFGCFCVFCWVFWCCLCFLLHELSHPDFLHTKVVEFFTCLSERALDLRFDSCHVALGI